MAKKPRKPKAPVHPTTAYAQAVVKGKIKTNKLVRLACKRHLDDLKSAGKRGLYFDEAAATFAINFYPFLQHTKGEWAGQPIHLDPWQKFIIGSIFGWKNKAGPRRFQFVFILIPRKNGKSTLACGVALFMLTADGEPGAEVYSAATKRDQAKIVYNDAKLMAEKSPGLSQRLNILNNNISIPGTASIFQPLSAEARNLDGLNTHCAICDEVHAHKSRDVIDALETSMGARRQPMLFEITIAGTDVNSICFEHFDYCTHVLEGNYTDEAADACFAYISGIDEGDDWQDPKVWEKANPGYGVSVKPKYLKQKFGKAMQSPAGQAVFRQRHLSEWTENAARWLNMKKWRLGDAPFDHDALFGRDCYAGLDLAKVDDLSAFVLFFPPVEDGESSKVIARFWVPEENIIERGKRDRVPYPAWRDQGFIQATPGETTDFRFIEAKILEDAEKFNIREIAYDRAFAYELVTNLTDEEITMVKFGQGWLSMAAPTAEIERLVKRGELQHAGNPVLAWNASNAIVKKDEVGNLKPDKKRSRERIDGIVALCNAMGRAMVHDTKPSIYEERGVIAV